MTVGLFGGTFAPFHRGHRAALESFLREVKPDHCIVMPSGIPPHKIKTTLFTDRQRLETARLGCEGLKGVTVSDWEIKKEGRSYTAETLRWLNETYPDRRAIMVASPFDMASAFLSHSALSSSPFLASLS